MLKKISIGSAILLLVCILVSIALLPFAIDDFGKMVAQYEAAHSGYEQFYEKNPEGITTLYLNDYYEDLEIVESGDGMIRASARETNPYTVSYAEILDADGQLTLDLRYNSGSGSNFNREYMVESILASMSGGNRHFRLEVPKGIAVKVRNYYRLTNPQELDVSLYQKTEPVHSVENETSEPLYLNGEQARAYYTKATNLDLSLENLVRKYELGEISADKYQEERTSLLESYSELLSELFAGTERMQDEDFSSILEKTQYDLEEDFIEATQSRLERDFRDKVLTKEEYYQQDLELERQKKEVEDLQDQYPQAEELLDLLEEIYGYDYSID